MLYEVITLWRNIRKVRELFAAFPIPEPAQFFAGFHLVGYLAFVPLPVVLLEVSYNFV